MLHSEPPSIFFKFHILNTYLGSLNMLRLSQVLSRNLSADPDSKSRYVNFGDDKKIILVKGANHPLDGELHSAQYFHGRFVLSVQPILLFL